MRIISNFKGYQLVRSQVVGCDVRTSLDVSIVRYADIYGNTHVNGSRVISVSESVPVLCGVKKGNTVVSVVRSYGGWHVMNT